MELEEAIAKNSRRILKKIFEEDSDLDEEKLNKKELESYLTDEDKQVLDALGPDLARKITSGEWEASRNNRG